MIRENKKEDINTLADIWLEASIIAHSFIPASYWESNLEDMKNIYIPTSNTLVFEENGDIKGFISLIDNYIAALFVTPNQQGKGIGKQLINRAKEIHENLQLAVYSENVNSIEFYKKQEFVVLEEKVEDNTGHLELVMQYKK